MQVNSSKNKIIFERISACVSISSNYFGKSDVSPNKSKYWNDFTSFSTFAYELHYEMGCQIAPPVNEILSVE